MLSFEVFEAFKKLHSKTYDVVEACKRQNLDETKLVEMRHLAKGKEHVPKILIDSQVSSSKSN